jgi:hypothetical protein
LTGPVTIGAGTASIQPILLTSGTNLTTAVAGSVEYDGSVGYFTSVGVQRGVWMAEQVAFQAAAFALSTATAAQKIFGTTISTNGAITLAIGTYEFECSFALSGLNTATSSQFGFALGGAATKTAQFQTLATASATGTGTSPIMGTVSGTSLTSLVGVNTTGFGQAYIFGFIRVTVAGTIIPQTNFANIATAGITVVAGAYFKIRQVSGDGTNAISTGNWT